ncbi:NucA/NucB deoxyribonuclease domain-containing protein [Streptomyces rhizosphaerihabitans]|uniref:NucA/NucB deoxyribonuclease domain-containing protein n=1 Tax=Streptomyces rhizosphaerihabitans TaxID=1266770 RepID=UPI0021C121CA|nr:NucA/NucB deoxyribonuclease domain-containing protein [Streptomyces rhizosphaerihabitans]MCT9007332.1 NucA/NucB deoxyribonuclease domain-containing protein [Streptomyces rhizosphaerihabitans]
MAALALILAMGAPAMSATPAPSPGGGSGQRTAADGKWIGKPVILTGEDVDKKTQRPRSAWRAAPAPKAKTASLSPEQAMKEALAEARKAGAKSYLDTSKVPLATDGRASAQAAALGLPPTNLGDEPPAQDTNQCLDRAGASSAQGETLNRWLWCRKMRIGVQYFKIIDGKPEYQGTNSVAYHAVAVGNGQQRVLRTYLQAQYDSVEYDDWSLWDRYFTAPDLKMFILSDCAESYEYCFATGSGIEHTFDEWDYHREWLHWDIYSEEEASTSTDKVLFHHWHFRFGGSGGGYVGPDATTADRAFRCDSADYFSQFGVDYPKACVNYEVIPHLQYDISDTRVSSVARHIRVAQDTPEKTYPIELEPKHIPGKYSGARDDQGLHRVADGSPSAQANEAMKDAACNRRPPYEDWRGLPPYDTATQDCDEYPFQSTEEGAGSFTWDFSVRAVPNGENRSAGGLLRWYYFSDRILYGTDAFWVEVRD